MKKRGRDEKKIPSDGATVGTPRDSSVIEDPSPTDVILGRGSAHAWRPGNSQLHNLVDYYQARYHGSSDRKTKANITNIVYESMKTTGRFLRKIPGTDTYQEVPNKTAREKIAHTFRDRRQTTASLNSQTRLGPVSPTVPHARVSSSGVSSSSQQMKRPPNTAGANKVSVPRHSQPDLSNIDTQMLGSPPQIQLTSPAIRTHFNEGVARVHASREYHDSSFQATTNDRSATAKQRDKSGSSPSSAESSHLFSDKDLLSVLGRPDEYTGSQKPDPEESS